MKRIALITMLVLATGCAKNAERTEIYGGCGAEMHGDSKEECLNKWNKRT